MTVEWGEWGVHGGESCRGVDVLFGRGSVRGGSPVDVVRSVVARSTAATAPAAAAGIESVSVWVFTLAATAAAAAVSSSQGPSTRTTTIKSLNHSSVSSFTQPIKSRHVFPSFKP